MKEITENKFNEISNYNKLIVVKNILDSLCYEELTTEQKDKLFQIGRLLFKIREQVYEKALFGGE